MTGPVPFLASYPGFLPGLAVTFVVAVALFRPVSRSAGIRPWLAFGILASLGLIVSATLFPDVLGLGRAEPATTGALKCDTDRWRPSLSQLVDLGESTANVALFAPLGGFAALLPVGHRRRAVLACVALPLAIEVLQMLVPSLNRACQTADIADNLTGLAAGICIAWLLIRATHLGRRRSSGSR